jgi:hypothetical protein
MRRSGVYNVKDSDEFDKQHENNQQINIEGRGI